MNQPGPKNASEPQSNRACDACRAHKVRCLPNVSGNSKTCQRCAKTDRQCFFTAPQRRKQRKRTDTRVAELEKEVQAMRALFESKASAIPEAATHKTHISDGALGENTASAQKTTNSEVPSGSGLLQESSLTPEITGTSLEGSPSTFYPNADVVDRGIISMEEACRFFQSYKTNFAQHYPVVTFSVNFTAEECRRTKPTLFLAILAAAAAEADPHLYSTLNTEVLTAYAHRTVMQHEKSLELVQAMIVCSVWYYPPGAYAQLKFYEFIHMAASMAIDIGLGKNPKSSRSLRGSGVKTEPEIFDDEELERRRTFLACYMITTGVSMSMRRPNMLRWNSWIHDCLESIANNPKITKLDRSLVCWVKLLKISEDIGSSFRFDDPRCAPDLSEVRSQIMMTGFEKELDEWKRGAELVGMNDALLLQFYHTELHLHEIGLHDDHPPEDFIPPMSLNKIISIHTLPEANSSFLEASAISISSAQTAMDIILKMEVGTLRVLPIVNYVRTCYAMITLIKLYISSKSPTSKIGAVLDSRSMRLDYYLEAVTEKFIEAVGPEQYRSPFIFLGIMMQFRIWYEGQKYDQFFSIPAELEAYKDACWLPPVPKIRWNAHFGTPAASPDSETEWKWDRDPEPLQSYLDTAKELDTSDMMGSHSMEFDASMMVGGVQYDQMNSDYDFDQTLLMSDIRVSGAMDDWVPSMDLPMLSGPEYPPDAFQWGSQKENGPSV